MMSSAFTNEHNYKEIFIDEAKDVLSRINNLLIELEKELDNTEILNEIFRLFHMLKGSAATIGATEISKLAHKTEDILVAIREGKLKVNNDIIDLLFEVVDTLTVLLASFERNGPLIVPQYLLKKIDHILIQASNTKPRNHSPRRVKHSKSDVIPLNDDELRILLSAVNKGLSIFRLTLSVKKTPLLSLHFFMLLKKINEQGVFIKSIPSGKDILAGKIPKDEITLLVAHIKEPLLREALSEIEKKANSLSLKEITPLDINAFGIKEEDLREVVIEEEHKLSKILSITEKESKEEIRTPLHLGQMDEIKVKVRVLDKLFNLTRELVIIRNRALSALNLSDMNILKDSLTALDRVVNELSNMVINIRLVPLNNIFQAFPRLIRDLAKGMNKEVDLILEGGEISIDRNILNELIDPLVSLIRNAIDHGIEPPEERLKKGKTRVGTIKVIAEKEGNYVVITVEDDGRGIDVDLVKKIAVEKGLITPEVASNLSYKEALMLVTLPGFSTKKDVSQISGRGMGLNAVKNKIEALGGTFDIWSEKDKGTKIILKVPMSMVTLKVLLIQEGGVNIGIPVSLIDFIAEFSKSKISTYGNLMLMSYKDSIVPVYSLSRLLGMPGRGKYIVIVLDSERKYVGISVSKILGMEDVVVENIDRSLLKLQWLNGVSVLGDGSICLIIDPIALIKEESMSNEGLH